MSSSPVVPPSPRTQRVLGVPIHLLSNYGAWLHDRLHQNQGTHVVTLNAEMAMLAGREPQLLQTIAQAELIIPDGAGVVLYLRCKGEAIKRAPGIEIAETLLANLAQTEKTAFFFGGQPGIAATAATNLIQKYPGLTVADTQHGYVQPAEMPALLDRLATLQPAVILVGLGVPRQEYWIAEHRSSCPNAIWIGVGGSFDVWGGIKQRAPKWMGDHHLEWLYRLYCEPWRWRRMLALPKFAWIAGLELLGLRKVRLSK